MARQVIWSDPAWEDVEAAAQYIGRDSESYAAAFVQNAKDDVLEGGVDRRAPDGGAIGK